MSKRKLNMYLTQDRLNGSTFNILDVWALNGDKSPPPFDNNIGWNIDYSTKGGKTVDRDLMNQNFYRLSAFAYDVNRYGGLMPWDNTVNYKNGAVVLGSNKQKFTAVLDNKDIDPTRDDGTNWQPFKTLYRGTNNIKITNDQKLNDVTIDTTVALDTLATKDTSNITVASLQGRFEAGANIQLTASGNKVKISSVADSLEQIIKLLHPIGGRPYITLGNEKPYADFKDLKWDLIQEGLAFMTGKDANVGESTPDDKGNRLDTGSTDEHEMTEEELVKHSVYIAYSSLDSSGDGNAPLAENKELALASTCDSGGYRYLGSAPLSTDKANSGKSSEVGESKPFSIPLNVKNLKLKVWIRTT